MNVLKKIAQVILTRTGYRLQKRYDLDIEKEFIATHVQVKNKTMTSQERQYALFKAVEYIEKNNIEGDIVECGVWKGGSSMLIAQTLKNKDDFTRTLYLYDTFAGMSEPTEKDKTAHSGLPAWGRWNERQLEDKNEWDYASLSEVKKNMESVGYPNGKVLYVQGKVEETIPKTIPEKIALLRLDTDWYESTKHELEYLFPKLVPGGILIIDDYGHWEGARAAVDEYLKEKDIRMFLNRIDYTGRLGIR
jgi:O-methyltransferase